MGERMKNYYDILEISKTASPNEIKRAYFGMVKKFPPERFPEEFKAIRSAYETLSDEKRRAEYDRRGELLEDAARSLQMAEESSRLGKLKQAGEILRSTLRTYPELVAVKAALARLLEKEGKNGAAIKLWEELCEQEPENAEYIHELALLYDYRGWSNKAAERYEKAVAAAPGQELLWEDYAGLLIGKE